MSVTLKVPTPLRRMTGGASTLETPGGTLAEVLERLDGQFPGLKARLLGDNNKDIHPYISIFINGDDVRYMSGLETAVKDGDEVTIVPAIAGG